MDFKLLTELLDLKNVEIINKKEMRCSCPLAPWTHDRGTDSKPSFGFKIADNGQIVYNCLSCKAKGRLSNLVDELIVLSKNIAIYFFLYYFKQ